MSDSAKSAPEPADMAFVPLDAEQAEWLRAHGEEPSQVLLALLKAAMSREGDTFIVPGNAELPTETGPNSNARLVALNADQTAFLQARGADPAQVLVAMLNAEIRRETLKKAVAEEGYIYSVIRKHAANLERQHRKQRPTPPKDDGLGWKLERRAERELLPTFEQSKDPRMRAAAKRYRFRHGIKANGTWTDRSHNGTPELQRMREQRPGGWR